MNNHIWREFDGIPGYPLLAFIENTRMLIWDSKRNFLDITYSNTMNSDGFHRGRNEYFTHYMIINLPEN